MSRILHEPLVHFTVVAALLFAFSALRSDEPSGPSERIVIGAAEVSSLAEGFARTWQRPPSADELEGLIADRVREEVYVREAFALGLDRDDVIIRRRLRQKLEFLTGAEEHAPTDEELAAYLEANAARFRVQPSVTFSQVFLDPLRRGEALDRDAAALLSRLRQRGDPPDLAAIGDSRLLEPTFDAISVAEIAKRFGDGFAAALEKLPVGQWHGPIRSGYGVHLVLAHQRTEARRPVLSEVRDHVRSEWIEERRRSAELARYDELLRRYAVIVERPSRQAPVETGSVAAR